MAGQRKHIGKLVDDDLSAKARIVRTGILSVLAMVAISLVAGLIIFLRVHD